MCEKDTQQTNLKSPLLRVIANGKSSVLELWCRC